MYKSLLKIGWRNLIKYKVFSMINISGLALGLTCSILIALWVRDEYRIDAFHKDESRIFTVASCEYSGSEINGGYNTPGLLADELKKVIPEVEYASSYAGSTWYTFAVGDTKVKMNGNFVGDDFLKIFSYPLLLGAKESALDNRESIAISKKMATILFGSPDLALNKSVRFENYLDLKVTAVLDDLGDDVSEKFEFLINWDLYLERNDWLKEWHNSGPTTFIKLREQANAESVVPKIRFFIKKYDKDYSTLDRLELGLQPFSEKYLHNNFKNGRPSGGRIEYVKLFEWVAIFVLVIACINFMNLSTARSVKRGKEIGVRKVNGAMKGALVNQFMIEAFLFAVIAMSLAILLLVAILPQFNLLSGKNILLPFREGSFWIGIAGLTLVTGAISGCYPAFLLSSFKAIAVLKGNVKTGASSVFLRKGLVIFQFALSMILIIGTIVISRQVEFIQRKDLGYQKNNLIYLSVTGTMASGFNVFKNEALKVPGVIGITRMSQRPVEMENATGGVEWEGKPSGTKPNFTQAAVGYDFVKTMQARMLYGRDFSEEHTDSSSYIINETALRLIGYADPVGKPLTFWGKHGTIIGVVKDFHFNTLHVPIMPLVLRLKTGTAWGYTLIRTEPGMILTAVDGLEKLHQKLNPDFPFAHQFADEEYGYSYQREMVVNKLSKYFAFLAIFISSIGLLGLVMFTAEQRTKEVGIRKVLGASVPQIVSLLSKDFMRLLIISSLMSAPVAYYIMSNWLRDFEYRTSIEWWVFAVAAGSAMLITMLTVSFQAVKAATADPVASLRNN